MEVILKVFSSGSSPSWGHRRNRFAKIQFSLDFCARLILLAQAFSFFRTGEEEDADLCRLEGVLEVTCSGIKAPPPRPPSLKVDSVQQGHRHACGLVAL